VGLSPWLVDMANNSPYSCLYKLTVVGAGLVGKSALTVRFIQGNFIEKYDATIEDSYRKQIEIDNQACMLDVMDTAGQEEYSALRDQYMQTAEGFIIVYSVTSRLSYDFCLKLRTLIMRLKMDQEDFPIVLVGNKSDLVDERQVSQRDGEEMSKKFGGVPFIETSAKENSRVIEAFHTAVREVNKFRESHPPRTPKKEKRPCILI